MRIILLLVAVLLVSTNALSTSEQTNDLRIASADAHINTLAKSLLRKKSTDDEERENPITSLAGKLKRLAKYNKWIFSGKKPQDVKDPRYQ
ncbi:hypothetical protein V7S43_000736 [Phytophthora oleae]|uniref:RxLR effector protein n=1 Tax=Phytophthora oleae TaxID=2107226 RepID=A0ABD3GCA6_9STRA